MNLLLNMDRIGKTAVAVLAAYLLLNGCRPSLFNGDVKLHGSARQQTLEVLSTVNDGNAQFSKECLSHFAKSHDVHVSYLSTTETVNSQLEIYQNLFKRQATHPDLYEIDVIWASILSDSLVDLTPYFRKEISEFEPEILRNFTVNGRLIALPTFLDVGVLYYRSDLLGKYGFKEPPSTWTQLEQMANVIQNGERQSGNHDFWGYVWQGGAFEGLTCNAVEWQASAGSPAFIDPQKLIHVRNKQTIDAVRRALSWIGRISPPGEPYYRETDSMNVWNAGNEAFMRNWVSSYRAVYLPKGKLAAFKTAALPGGPGGQRGTLGGLGMGISQFSPNRKVAIEALRALTSQRTEESRSARTGTIPTRIAPRNNPQVMQRTALPGQVGNTVMSGLIARPALVTGEKYATVSRAFYKAINAALLRKQSPEAAMATLERDLALCGAIPGHQ